MAKAKYWYIKERRNPQLMQSRGKPYYTALGNITQTEAKKHESSLYGMNFVLRFSTEEEYKQKLTELGI